MMAGETRAGLLLREPRHVIAVLRLLVLAGIALLGVASPPAHRYAYWVLTLAYAVTIFGYLWARNRSYDLQRIKWMIFLFDVAMVSALILARGDRPSEFLTAYFGLVLIAAIVDGLGNAVTNAVLVSAAYAVITRWGLPVDELLSFPVMSQFVFFFVIAVFMGHLATEARSQAAGRDRTQAALTQTSHQLQVSTEKLKAVREALRANDRLATLGMLSAGIAHELKNPVAAIVGNLEPAAEILQDLERSASEDGPVREDLAELRSIVEDCRVASDQLLGMARDLTSVARGASAQTEPVSPAEAVERAHRMLHTRAQNGLTIETEILTRREVLGDRSRILQVLLNLGGNALDAMEEVGHGTLRMAAEDGPAGTVVFVVADTGPGMSEETRRRAFDPFFTTKSPGKGTGLGLHVVSEIVKAQRGSIDCQTKPGEGTTFRVTLPGTSETDHGDGAQDPADRRRRGDDPSRAEADVPAGAVRAVARV